MNSNSHNNIKIEVIKNFKRCFLLLLMVFFMACQSDDDQPQPEATKNGFWLAADKGYIIEINDNKSVLYNINKAGCAVVEDDFVAEESFGISLDLINANELIGRSELIASDIKFTRLLNQNEFCLPDQLSKTDDPKVNFDHFWNIFNDYYVFFETRNVNWSQYESLRDQVTSENFYDVVIELIFLFKDGHVAIEDEANGIEINSGLPSLLERLNSSLSGDLIIDSEEDYDRLYTQRLETIGAAYLGNKFEADESENIAWGLINDNIAYINVFGMAGYSTNEKNELETLNTVLDRMMNDLEDSGISKLILDIRFNEGGYDMVSVNIASRFVDQEQVVFSKKARLGDSFTESTSISVTPKGDFQFTGDIIVLTSPLTASAAEIFTLCMKDLPYVTIVGDNTNGVFSDILTHTLPNGALIGLSNEVYSDANGKVFETIGVGPSEENRVPLFSNDDFIEEKDSGIDLAIEILNKTR
ncbi:S41 family peptidase [Aquimarina algiphila]|uniref:S41 family peptidase n=1 Tax=Aquimarina algiphila TaxID=2047982 RepID=A0A554VP01_9FLAO|nr:S41 family peptidase [Aquimarina algiphila]TSE10109.1 S41 family peptidase [Aquimarina algiphila]